MGGAPEQFADGGNRIRNLDSFVTGAFNWTHGPQSQQYYSTTFPLVQNPAVLQLNPRQSFIEYIPDLSCL